MKKSVEHNLWKGRKIKVFSTSNKYLGVWEYDKAVRVGSIEKNGRMTPLFVPRFRQGKKTIHGYACWWIPLSVALRAEEYGKQFSGK